MSNHPIPDEVKAQIITLYDDGVLRQDIQAQTGVSQPTIRNILEEAGYPRREQRAPRPIGRKTIKKVVDMRNSGLSYGAIADQLDISKRSVIDIVAEHVEKITTNSGSDINPEEFIKAWQESESIKEVALKLKCTVSLIRARAGMYRQKGINLKAFRTQRVDWDDLSDFADAMLDDD